jgi:putative ABC transport system permease protein
LRFGHWKHGRTTAALTAVDPATIGEVATLRMREGSLSDLADGGVVVSERVAERDGLAAGDRLAMTFPRDGERDLPVVGVSEDVDATVFVDLAPGVDERDARAAIDRALADFPTAEVRDLDAAVDSRTAVVGQILGLVTVCLLFTVVVALLGITNTLALSILDRTREIGLLRAVGMTDGQLRWMVRTEAVLLAALAVLAGVALGVGDAAATVQALADDGSMRVVLPAAQAGAVVAMTVGAGLVAGLVPARRAARLRLLDALGA